MTKVKSIKNYGIYFLSEIDKKNRNMTSSYALISNEELEYSPSMREIEFEADNIQELIDFVGSGDMI